MRLKEDDTSWNAGNVKRRMYRQSPLTPEQEERAALKSHKKKKPRPKKNGHKHVWVEVGYDEYRRYSGGHRSWSLWWIDYIEPPFYAQYYTFYVCADCLACKTKVDKGKQRAAYRKKYGRSW